MRGLSFADVTSVLLKFASLLEVENYIHVEYLEYSDIQKSYFQVHFINIDMDRKSKLDKKNYAKLTGTTEQEKGKTRKREQHKFCLDNIRGSPKHKIRIEKIEI